MGFVKNSLISFLNKRHFYLIKTYAYYRKDLWGFLRMKRLYRYKKIIYNLLRYKKKFYGLILYKVYGGIKFTNKDYRYRAHLFFTKKRLKLFYGSLKDTYLGKLGTFVKGKNGVLINYFYSLLERRLDVLLYRSLYTITVRSGHKFIDSKLVYVNNSFVKYYGTIIYVGDLVRLKFKTIVNPLFFFKYGINRSIDTFNKRYYLFYFFKNLFLEWYFFDEFYKDIVVPFVNVDEDFKDFRRNMLVIHTPYLLKKKYMKFLMDSLTNLPFRFLFFLVSFIKVLKKLKKINKNILRRKRIYINKRRYYFSKRLIFLYIQFIFLSKKLQLAKKEVYNKHCRRFIHLYGLVNLRIRVKKFFFFLRPKIYSRVFTFINNKRRLKVKNRKKFRFWNFSRAFYDMLKKMKNFFFVYSGYLSHLEVNYKTHIILLVRLPKINTIMYPFGVNKWIFFDYFRRRGYF